MKLIFEGTPSEFAAVCRNCSDYSEEPLTSGAISDGKFLLSGTINAIFFDNFTLDGDFGYAAIYVEDSAKNYMELLAVGDFVQVRVDFQPLAHELSIYYKLVATSRADFVGYVPRGSGNI